MANKHSNPRARKERKHQQRGGIGLGHASRRANKRVRANIGSGIPLYRFFKGGTGWKLIHSGRAKRIF